MNNGLCQYVGCNSIATQNGTKLYCHAHGGRGICRYDGCRNLAQAAGVCITHGWKKRRCSIDGCNKQSQNKNGKCKKHGGATLCSFNGCGRPMHARKMCKMHIRMNVHSSAAVVMEADTTSASDAALVASVSWRSHETRNQGIDENRNWRGRQ